MDEMIARANGAAMGPRVPIGRRMAPLSEADVVKRAWVPTRIVDRSSSTTSDASAATTTCSDSSASNTCEKPVSTSVAGYISIGIAVPLAIAFICCLVYFHRRNVKRQAAEDRDPHHRSLDFGMGDVSANKTKRKSLLGLGGEKNKHPRGLSIDMNLSSPYLLPDHVQGSRESMNSLAKTLHQADDPYRPVTKLLSETGSIRTVDKGRYTPSVMSTSTKRMSRQSTAPHQPLRQNSYPKSPLTPSASSSVTAVESDVSIPPTIKEPASGPAPPPQCDLPALPVVPEIRHPAPVAQRDAREPGMNDHDADLPDFSNSSKRESDDELNLQINVKTDGAVGLGLLNGPQSGKQPLVSEGLSSTSHGAAGPVHQSVSGVIETTEDYADFDYAALVTRPEEDDDRGRSRVRESGLAVPQQGAKRLSVGLRPLPPTEITESEDPETRANRIRSFYKEYFDDSKPAPPMPEGASAIAAEYDGNHYGGEGAYFDPDSNQFIMPYAQPVSRRAMTPPPSGSRFPGGPRMGGPGPRGPGPMGPNGPGPRGPPRNFSGSIGGQPRAGSAMSYGPRPDSSASARGPRSGSAMSGKPKKNLPPPSPLNTLPTPGKLTDDHFALINASDFAPPESFGERAAGRSQSPLGERRAYAPKLPAVSPLVNTFDEMAALPSPHMLRKSGQFTGLDFAPPKKFKDSDNMSDAGSIRSNRSGLSRANEYAIRNGAGRLSRLPGDIIFSQAQLNESLKPTMNMHGNFY
ncbi:hypothetical protein BD289DRAFT_485078 [Coniella lustricola]|uniref:Uncharacterized protein n=1 Tax=Coniella lustricola TaxID=2025994 RepID=A0A2T2ZZY7_9PEZI|nr:hypothetical protein BD289DRAFT_485078 [Coniella lustricola]